MTQPTDRPGIDQITSDGLDQLYVRLTHAEREVERLTDMAVRYSDRAIENGQRADRAEATLTAVRAELDRMAALSTVTYDDGRADTFPVGARWAIRMIRKNALGEPQKVPDALPVHIGNRANAEDCPACEGTNPPYPFICPGPKDA